MTEYEMAHLNNEYVNTGALLLSMQFSILSAFLVAAYVAAHRLTLVMSGFVVAAFVFSSIVLSMTMYRSIVDFIGLRHAMFVAAKEGKGLAWHSAAQFDMSAVVFPAASPAVFPTIWMAMALGAVFFFFHCRRVNLKAETPSPQAVTSA